MGKKELEKTKRQSWEVFNHTVGEKARRKLLAQRQRNQSIWFGVSLFGLVGWSVVTPTLMGVALGIWIDTQWPSRFSWTLMLLFMGLTLGCLNAWQWVSREQQKIQRTTKEPKIGVEK